jgi:hypothetical protein
MFLFSCQNNPEHAIHEHQNSSLGKLEWHAGDQMEMYMLVSGNKTKEPNFEEITYSHDVSIISKITVLEKTPKGFVVQCKSFNKHMFGTDSLYNRMMLGFQDAYSYLIELDAYGCLIEIQNLNELEELCKINRAKLIALYEHKGRSKEEIELSLKISPIPENRAEILKDFEGVFGTFFTFYSNNADTEEIVLSMPDTLYRLSEERSEVVNHIVKTYSRYKSSDGKNHIKKSLVYNSETTWLENYTVFKSRQIDSSYFSTKTEFILRPIL